MHTRSVKLVLVLLLVVCVGVLCPVVTISLFGHGFRLSD